MSHKVSIIIPLYNKAPYVTKALESVKAQTFTDYECLIVNDGSIDNSEAVVQSWLSRNSQYTVHFTLYTQENAGVSAARNHGISLSTGEYICFLDADDWWAPTFLEEMMGVVKDYPEAGIYACDYYRVKNGKLLTYPKHVSGYINYYKVYTHSGAMPIHSDGVLVPRWVLEEMEKQEVRSKKQEENRENNPTGVGRGEWFPVGIKMGEDFLFFMKIVSRYKVAFLDKQLVYFNQDADANNRATSKLHDPRYHMLWNLGRIEDGGLRNEDVKNYKDMIDFLRMFSLGAYLESVEYHDAAAAEMAKVSRWNKLRFTLKRYWMKIDNKLKQL